MFIKIEGSKNGGVKNWRNISAVGRDKQKKQELYLTYNEKAIKQGC